MKKLIYTLVILAFVSSVSAQWSEQSSGVTTILKSISAVDNNVVWVCGYGGKVLRTTNGGTNWVTVTSPNSGDPLNSILGIDANNALVSGLGSMSYLYKTTNGGSNWSLVFSQTGGIIHAISFMSLVNNTALFMLGSPVGGRWSLWQSTNAGTNWDSTGLYVPQAGNEIGYDNSLYVWRGPYYSTKIWFGTNNSKIYYYKYGQGWSAQSTGTQTDILTMFFSDTLNGSAGSTTGGLYTTNGGQTWGNNPTYIGSGSVTGVTFTHEGVYYTRGSSVYFSANGYNYTAYTQTGTYNHLTHPPNFNNVWAIRNNGGISKYTSSVGITPISTEVPSAYSLSQNYPNPFNPRTVINFQLPISNFVTLKIYDMMGREVQTLVNESLKPGTYEATFDGSNLSSGTYFYKLTSGNYTQTKKLTLIK